MLKVFEISQVYFATSCCIYKHIKLPSVFTEKLKIVFTLTMECHSRENVIVLKTAPAAATGTDIVKMMR